MPAWNPNLRSKTAIRTSDIRYYIDPSIAIAAADLECDAVIHLRNGSYGLIEIKIGGESAIEHGASTLKSLEYMLFRLVAYAIRLSLRNLGVSDLTFKQVFVRMKLEKKHYSADGQSKFI